MSQPSNVGSWTAIGKDAVALLRDLSLVVLFLLLIFRPVVIGERLSAAGFEEGSIMGFKWHKKAEDFGSALRKLQQSLEDANRQIADQRKVIAANQVALANASRGGVNGNNDLQEVNAASLRRSAAVAAAAGATLVTTAPVVEQARELAGDAQWAVVMSGDPTIESAQYEVDLAKRRGVKNAQLYLRQGWYRTVAKVNDRAEADDVLKVARKRQASPYLVDLRIWCPRRTTADGVVTCS